MSSGGNTYSLAHKYFSQLDLETITNLYDLYKVDFELFDYIPNDYFEIARDNDNKNDLNLWDISKWARGETTAWRILYI